MAELLRARGWERVALVTSTGHMPRALATFRRYGVDAVPGYAASIADRMRLRSRPWAPREESLEVGQSAGYGYFAWVYYWLLGRLAPAG